MSALDERPAELVGGAGNRDAVHPQVALVGIVIDEGDRLIAQRAPVGAHLANDRHAGLAGAHHQHAGPLEGGLPRSPDLAQHDVAGIAFEFFGIEHDRHL